MIHPYWKYVLAIMPMVVANGAKQPSSIGPAKILMCGEYVGCFKWPPNCNVFNCTIIIRFTRIEKSLIAIEISGKVDGWIAFGINEKPRIMGGTTGEVCIKGKSQVTMLRSFENEGTDFDMKDLNTNITKMATGYTEGRISCAYNRPVKSSSLLDVSKPRYLIASWGKTKMKGSKIHAREHETGDYFWSKSKVVLTKMMDVPVTSFGWGLIAAHGSLMVIAWIGFGLSGIFFARHMREVLQNKKICGNSLWFQIHQISMFCSSALVIIAFIIILAEAKGWNTEMDAHPVLGIITVLLVVAQAIAGVFRPAVNSPRRYIFKMAHRLVGAISYIFAVITIFLGFAAMEVDLAVLILYLVASLLVFVAFEIRKFYKLRRVVEVPYQESELDSAQDSTDSDDTFPTYSTKEIFIHKIAAGSLTGMGIGMAIVLVSLIAHKGYVYAKKKHV